MGFLAFTGLDNLLPESMGGKPKLSVPAVTAQNFQPAPAPAPAQMSGAATGTLAGGRRRRSHKRRAHRKTKKHSRR